MSLHQSCRRQPTFLLALGGRSCRSACLAAVVWAIGAALTAQTPVPTTADPGLDSSERPQLVPTGTDHVHVVWQDFRDGSWGIYYREAVIGTSITFPATDDTRLNTLSNNDTVHAVDPRIAVARPNVVVVWRELDVANRVERVMSTYINLNASTPTWSTPATLSGSLSHVHDLELVASGNNLLAAWIQSDTSFSPDQGFYIRSTNNGASWGSVAKVDDETNSDPDDAQAEVAVASGNGVFSIAYISRNGPSTQPDYDHVMLRKATGGTGSFSTPVALTTEIPSDGAQAIIDLNVAMSANGSTIAATWVLSRAGLEGLRSNWSTNGGSSFQTNEAPVSEDLAPDENEGVFYSTDLAGGSGSDVYSCFTFIDLSVDGPTYVYAAKLNNSSGGWLDAEQVSGAGPTALEKTFLPLDRPRVAANSTDLVVTWMQNTATYPGDFDVQVRTAPVSSSWPPSWDASPASVTGKSTGSGMPEARSGWPRVLLHAGKAVIVWDDRENWTPPGGSTTGLGAPTVKIKAVSL